MKDLVPPNCLVNLREIIPGLGTELSRLPLPHEATKKIPIKKRQPIYLHNVHLVCSPEFEKQFE